MIKRFKITKLFGFRNIDISFDSDIKILIGENGLGKTTVLNALYYVLSEMYIKLLKIDFEQIELVFNDNDEISFSKYELNTFLEYKNNRERRTIPPRIKKQLDELNLDELRKKIPNGNGLSPKNRKYILDYIRDNEIPKFAPTDIMIREIYRYINEPKFENFVHANKILKKYNFNILYLPTYRRVEEDLKNLGKFRKKVEHLFEDDFFYEEVQEDIEITDDTLIHFGMEDVEKRIKKIQDEINKSTIVGFSKVTGEMLSQLLRGFPTIEDKAIDKLDENTVKIIIHRVGDNLETNDRNQILKLLENKDELKKKKELVYFIDKLIDIYEQHKYLDNSVKSFRDMCNNYLSDKEFRYDESSVNLDIYRINTEENVSLNKLSSGEKQIISIFSKLHLENNENLLVLFDEPELSLSLPWQKRLLPDIVNSDKCKFLLSVTHSPFIFENELDCHAVGMKSYISEYDIDE